jgi:REP element-mobilizing transposase RayT
MLRAHALERCRVEALMLMRNHVHLVVTPEDAASLSRWMKSWEQRYAVYRNRDRGASGKLFEQRFKSIPITSEAQLAATIPYVEVNPTRVGCCDDPGEWRWSTYSLHAGTGPTHELVLELCRPSSWWMGLSADLGVRQRMYRELVARRLETMDWRDVHRDSIRLEPKEPYTRRLRRPDGSRAAESLGEYRRLATSRQALNDLGSWKTESDPGTSGETRAPRGPLGRRGARGRSWGAATSSRRRARRCSRRS